MLKLLAIASMLWIPAADVGAAASASPPAGVAILAKSSVTPDHHSVGHLTSEQKAWFSRTIERILEGK